MGTFDLEEAFRFHSLSEFKESMHNGAEVVFEWKGQEYGIWSEIGIIRITHAGVPQDERHFSSVEEVLDYQFEGGRLRNSLTQIDVLDRTT